MKEQSLCILNEQTRLLLSLPFGSPNYEIIATAAECKSQLTSGGVKALTHDRPDLFVDAFLGVICVRWVLYEKLFMC